MCAGTYSITIYCGYSLDFIIGYFKAFSNTIFNFDSYGVSIDFSDDNSKTSVSSIAWFILMILLLQILKHFLLLLQLLILKLLVTLLLGFDNSKAFGGGCFNSFEDGVISYDFNIIAIGV